MAKKKQPTFAERAKDIMKRYGYDQSTGKFKRGEDPITMSSMEMELAKLKEEQEIAKETADAEAIRNGQELEGMPMMAYGGEIIGNPPYSPYYGMFGIKGQVDPDYWMYEQFPAIPYTDPKNLSTIDGVRPANVSPAITPFSAGGVDTPFTLVEDVKFLNKDGTYESEFDRPDLKPAPGTMEDLGMFDFEGKPTAYTPIPRARRFNDIRTAVEQNPELGIAAATQLAGTAAKAIGYSRRDQYNPIKFEPTQIPEFEKIDNREAVKGIRSAASGAKGSIMSRAGSRGELLSNMASVSSNEMSAVAQAEEQVANANAQARNAYNMQVAQIRMQDAARKLQTGMINKEAYDQITANWMGIANEAVSGISGTFKDMASAKAQENASAFMSTGNYSRVNIKGRWYPSVTGADGKQYYIDRTGKYVEITT